MSSTGEQAVRAWLAEATEEVVAASRAAMDAGAPLIMTLLVFDGMGVSVMSNFDTDQNPVMLPAMLMSVYELNEQAPADAERTLRVIEGGQA